MDIEHILAMYKSGELERDNDEKDAGGFWDLARELATVGIPEVQGDELAQEQDAELEDRQEAIYNALLEVYEGK